MTASRSLHEVHSHPTAVGTGPELGSFLVAGIFPFMNALQALISFGTSRPQESELSTEVVPKGADGI